TTCAIVVAERRAPLARLVAHRRLDPDHIGAVGAQDFRRVRAGPDAAEGNDFYPRQGARILRPCSLPHSGLHSQFGAAREGMGMPERSPKKQLDGFIAKFEPGIGRETKKVLAAMRKRLPGALELVYDNYNALAVGFAPTERASDVIFSIAVYPKWVSLFLFGGQKLKDPKKLLRGSGNTVRHIVLKDGVGTLDHPDMKVLMDQC